MEPPNLSGSDCGRHDLSHTHPDAEDEDDDQLAAPSAPTTIRSESKPRLSKDAQETLEAHFRQQQKPTTVMKRGFAEDLGVPLDKINVGPVLAVPGGRC